MATIVPLLLSSVINPAAAIVTTSATVAADKTYGPEGFQLPGVARWVDRSGGIAIGYPSFSMSVRPPNKGSRIYKVTAKLVLPTLEQTSPSTSSGIQPAPTKAYDLTCVMEFMLPERSTLAERTAFFSQVHSLFMRTITASDADPSSTTASPLEAAVTTYEPVF